VSVKTIRIGERLIGDGQPTFLAAEIGINHNGSMDLAHKLIDAAADAGADAVKFQNYRTEDFISDRALTYQYVSQGKPFIESQYEMFKRCELSASALLEARQHCDRRGMLFFSTPTSEEGIADLVQVGALLVKNGSDYLGHLPLIKAMARSGLPTVISTGMATLAEIDDAVRAFRQANGQDLITLVCTSSYPTPPEDVHLRRIPALANVLGCPIGLSDHTWGIVAAVGAVALGACFIEKHFTLDKNLPGPDHRFSAEPSEFRALVEAVRAMEKSLGDSIIAPAASEELGRRDFRLSCVAARSLPAGHCLTESDVVFRRPGTGLPPHAIDWIVGKRLKRDVSVGKLLQPNDLS
jgi:N-acetylneuraminate synthase/N,N'-diacetyllegionaminate synthase